MDEAPYIKQIREQANNTLDYLNKSTKNIRAMEIEFVRWDCQIKFEASYLNCRSLVLSQSISLITAKDDNSYVPSLFNGFDNYVLRTTIYNLAERLFLANGR